jgi:hypothetical protein
LSQPFRFEYSPGLSQQKIAEEANAAHLNHRMDMIRLLREQAGLPPEPPAVWPARQLEAVLQWVIKAYVPAFGPFELVPAKRPVGRPASGLTARQKAAIDEAVANGETVISACRRLARGKNRAKKAEAMAATWRRATKP